LVTLVLDFNNFYLFGLAYFYGDLLRLVSVFSDTFVGLIGVFYLWEYLVYFTKALQSFYVNF
jgi:hypothetical protein